MCDPLLARGVAGPAPMDPLTVVSRRIAFKQADLSRALKGALSAGLKPGSVEIDQDGKIIVNFGDAAPLAPTNSFDGWKAKRHARSS